MQNVQDFIRWALTHAKSVPIGAAMPLPIDACCAERLPAPPCSPLFTVAFRLKSRRRGSRRPCDIVTQMQADPMSQRKRIKKRLT